MLVSTLIERISYALRGTDDEVPTVGGDETAYWLSIINRKKDEWATDPFEAWGSLFEVRTLADPVEVGTQSYDLDADFIRPSDDVYVTVAGQRIDFNLVEPQLRDSVSNAVYLAGKKLYFVDTILTDSQIVGGAITVPGFFLPDDMDSYTDVVPVDDPNWLALATAAEIAFNDVSYEDKGPDLFAKANSLYVAMKTANKKGTITAPRKVPTMVKRIGRSRV
jgi:hypothetical protein